MEKYEIPLGWVRFEPTPATTAAPSPSDSGDITTAPLRLLKKGKRKVQGMPQPQTTAPPRYQEEEETDKSTKFMEQYYAWFLRMTCRIVYILVH